MASEKSRFRPDGSPVWFHPQGKVVEVVQVFPREQRLYLGNKCTELIVENAMLQKPTWIVTWTIGRNSRFFQTRGIRLLTHYDFLRAFGWSRDNTFDVEEFLRQYGGTTGTPGKFIRYEKYLNIPTPGLGRDRDPSMSIFLTDAIRSAVEQILR